MKRIGYLLLIFFSVSANAASLKAISKAEFGNKTSFYLSIEGHFTHRLFLLSTPNRLVLDLNNTCLLSKLNVSHLNTALIKQVRSGKPNPNTLRLVFELSQNVKVTSSPWRPQGSGLNGLKIDVLPIGKAPLTRPSTLETKGHTGLKPKVPPAPSLSGKSNPIKSAKTPIKALHVPALSLRNVVVVLDAGHGGKDPGAKGPHKSREKDVVLAITLKLKRLIDRQPGMQAVLTRTDDYYVGLRRRLDMARKYNGDVFVSIHADAFNNPHSNGASVFALSQRGATSEAARWLAEKENYSELGGINLGELDDQNGVVRSVLIDLSQTATINSGLQMGKRVLTQLGGFTSLHNNKVEQARFMVLKSPDIPSILVETGFISNPKEERNLTNPAYQNRLSQAIFQGIKGYFWESPPHGSRIEAMILGKKYHIAHPGETLESIARNYHVSLASLSALNHLSGQARLKLGQKIMIPSAWS